MPVLNVSGATVSYGGRAVVRGVDLAVEPGEAVALMGANGSGKSTLIKAVAGLVPLAGGSIELFGTPQKRFRAWKRIGYVPQRTGAASGVPSTAAEVVSQGRLAHRLLGMPPKRADRDAVTRSLAEVGLADHAHCSVDTLSGGQQQRVLIARALATDPELLIMDEPTVGVDAETQAALATVVADRIDAGCAVLLVTHELGPLTDRLDRAVVLADGKVVHDGAPPRPVGEHADPHHEHAHPHANGDAADEAIWGGK
ncbi:metal ABC transporter ATP-binding protein [Glycomyces niveus]|jgi:zinc transport system ATP-binding protein|uniref:Metal ABC transporter ATP-binding protein n=1 Tax=Glycomyces niveus TaxID=2820287 RepID=A0ABS3U3X4_9ACTN|nr:metal ABC transporter ATP-binding protein [Glycomyces sp. NEAU-S30]MBO3733480.1 metal ABC transporter ATP-binding protein [Glycomyces sp. NEAU-S30]